MQVGQKEEPKAQYVLVGQRRVFAGLPE
jgi:hypothetical protein